LGEKRRLLKFEKAVNEGIHEVIGVRPKSMKQSKLQGKSNPESGIYSNEHADG
jgi:hypothetical protein